MNKKDSPETACLPIGRIINLSFFVYQKLRVTAVDAVTADKNKWRVGNYAVTHAHISEFNLCSQIHLCVVKHFDFFSARNRIGKIYKISGQLVKFIRFGQTVEFIDNSMTVKTFRGDNSELLDSITIVKTKENKISPITLPIKKFIYKFVEILGLIYMRLDAITVKIRGGHF